jgi:signal transduction histidine kinase
MNILLLDDEQSFVDDFCEQAKSLGYQVIAYLNARGVWDQLKARDNSYLPDICFVDYELSNMKGTDFIRELRQRGFLFPVVLLTHYDDPQIAFEAGISGATNFCQKNSILSTSDSLSQIAQKSLEGYESIRDASTRRTEQTYRGINNFIAEFIHDIKDMVIPIQQSSQVALEEANSNWSNLSEDISESLTIVVDELNAIKEESVSVIAYLQDLSKNIHIKSDDVLPERVEVREFVNDCCQQFVRSGRILNVNVSLNFALFDPRIVKRILKNLLSNLEKHVPPDKEADILVSSRGDGSTSMLRIVVRDYGPGIPLELISTIFRPGVVGEKKTGNMGLGLSIAKHLAESYVLENVRGALYCVNIPDSIGARFDLEIPVEVYYD